MATTTNYGWTTPDDTALVKDGAAAIRTLGTSVDTTTKNLNPETTLGDIAYRSSTSNVNTRLGIGSTGNVLTVAGGVPSWAAPAAGGGMTLINTGGTTLTGASITVSSIPSTYKHLYIVISNVRTSTSSPDLFFRLNSDTGSNYVYSGIRNIAGTVAGRGTNTGTSINEIFFTSNSTTVLEKARAQIWIPNYNETSGVALHYQSSSNTGSSYAFVTGSAVYNNSAAISSFTLLPQSGTTWTEGTIYVYGVS